MEGQIVAGNIGPEANYKVSFAEGKLVLESGYVGADAEAGAFIKVKAGAVLDALKAAIPGHFDDAVIDGAKALLGV